MRRRWGFRLGYYLPQKVRQPLMSYYSFQFSVELWNWLSFWLTLFRTTGFSGAKSPRTCALVFLSERGVTHVTIAVENFSLEKSRRLCQISSKQKANGFPFAS